MSELPPNLPPSPPPPPPTGPWSQGMAPAPRPTVDGATTALVLGILGLVMCGPFTAIPAMIVGRRATREVDASQGRLDGRGTAQAGFILGLIGTVLGGLAILFMIFVLVLGGVAVTTFRDSCIVDQDSQTVECA
jgi:hypothetical protein